MASVTESEENMTRTFLLLLCLACATARAQDWTTIPLGTSADIYAVENTYLPRHWVSGGRGFAAWSNDDRSGWTSVATGTDAQLFSVQEPTGSAVYFGAGGGRVRFHVYQFWFDRNLPSTDDFRLFSRETAGVVAVGIGGRIFTSTDAGNTWTPRESGTTADLNAGDGSVTGPAWAVGNGGTILRSADGVTWTPVASGTTADLWGFTQLDRMSLYAVGAAGTILKSLDGGLTWTPRPSGTTRTLRAVSISKQSQDHLLAVGLGGTILRSTDAGETWCLLQATTVDLYGAEAVNDTEFLVAGAGGLLMRTTNGGGQCAGASAVARNAGPDDLLLDGPFPQPATGRALFMLPAKAGRSTRVEVFDSGGRLVRAVPELRSNGDGRRAFTLDTRDWAAGVYLIRARTDGDQATRRLVVTR
jgi:photosystem II stability/assembly factor-like uncharacterized protein